MKVTVIFKDCPVLQIDDAIHLEVTEDSYEIIRENVTLDVLKKNVLYLIKDNS